ALADRAREEVAAAGQPMGDIDLGVMLEIPSAILVSDSYFEEIRFASLGTNDLLQYTLAVDRGNPALERYRDSLHPALLRLVRLGCPIALRGPRPGQLTRRASASQRRIGAKRDADLSSRSPVHSGRMTPSTAQAAGTEPHAPPREPRRLLILTEGKFQYHDA